MLKKSMRRKALALAVTGGALFQIFSCGGLGQAGTEILIGFARQVGAIPANILLSDLLTETFGGLLPSDGDE